MSIMMLLLRFSLARTSCVNYFYGNLIPPREFVTGYSRGTETLVVPTSRIFSMKPGTASAFKRGENAILGRIVWQDPLSSREAHVDNHLFLYTVPLEFLFVNTDTASDDQNELACVEEQ